MLLSLPAGAIIDRHDRATLMWRAQAVQCGVVVIVAVLIVAHAADIGMLAMAGFCLGTAEVVFSNSAQAILPQLVPPDQLPKANGNQYVAQTVGESFAGPPLGSLLFPARAAAPFALDAASFAGSAALLARLPRGGAQPGNGAGTGSTRALIAEGLRWLLRHPLLRVVAVLLGVANFCFEMGEAVLVLYATQVLHVGTRGYGLLLAATAVGSVVGGLVNPVLTRQAGLVASLIISMAALSALFVGIGLAPDAVVVAVLMACQGFGITMWNVVTVSLRQTVVPAALLGRVNSVYRMLGWGLVPLGALAGGFVAHAGGLRAPYIVAGVLSAAALLAGVPLLLRAKTAQT
jgi:MFS family permease